jgi:PAS domain-containing protein
MEWLKPLSSQWQLGLLALVVVMGSLVWRMQRRVRILGGTSEKMREQLAMLSHSVEGIEGRTTDTQHTLIANMSEYRMAMGSTSPYREYLQQLGVAPTLDVEPILEALPDGAIAVSNDGRILYANRFMSERTGIRTGMTLEEIVRSFDVCSMDGESLTLDALPETRVLAGEEVREALLRLRAPGADRSLVLFVNGCPVRDVLGRVVAAVMVARPISEEVALAIQVRQLSALARDDVAVFV